MAVPELGWSTLAEAKSYFTNQRLETDAWDELADDDTKNKVLNFAYSRIIYNPIWSIPAAPSAAELVKLKLAQWEFAYYFAIHLGDEDRRKGLQAQGVTAAGIVKETYSENMLNDLPVPPFVIAILAPWKTERHFGAVDLERDEAESVDTKVHDF